MAGAARSGARVVIIGGGIGGVSAAYHLALRGVRDVMLLERAELSSGTTWHSTGNMETYRADPLIFEMVRYAAETYPRIARESGQDIGWRVVGRVMYTDREERWAQMRALPELGRARGIDIEVLSPAGIERRLPLIDAQGLLGGIWIPSDARVNPTDAVSALARLARNHGVEIRERCRVLGITVQGGSVRAVTTTAGEVSCDLVVLAAGLWSGDLSSSCGLRLPLHALEHQYLITKPFGVARDLPLFLSFDDQLYGREEVGGLIVGSLDDHAIPLSTAQLPQSFSSCLLSERWDQFEPYMATAMRRFPALKNAPVKMLLNGPESFTPDGQMLLGPVPGVSGLYACCGFNSNGMALAPAAGRYVAEWITEGAPSADVAALDVRRFSQVQSAPDYLRERVTEIPGYHCRMRAPDEDYQTARNVRHSPLHAELVSEGAKFGSINGWERPLWFAHGSRDSSWIDALAVEMRATLADVLAVDRSSDVKILLVGAGLAEWLDEYVPVLLPADASQALSAPLPGAHGELQVLARVLERRADRCLLTAGPDQETRLAEWLRAHLPAHFRAVDQTGAYACFELHGPRRAALLPDSPREGDGAAGTEARISGGWLGSARIDTHEDHIQGSLLVTVPSESAVHAWRALRRRGRECNLEIGGHFAQEGVRIVRGIPRFGREIGPSTLIAELCADRSRLARCDAAAVPASHRPQVVAAFASPMPQLGFGAHEVILDQGRVVGELTSRLRLPGWDATLALGRVAADLWRGQALETVADGRTWPLTARESPWHTALGRSPK